MKQRRTTLEEQNLFPRICYPAFALPVNIAAAETAILSPQLQRCCLDAPRGTKLVCLCPSVSRDGHKIYTELERTELIIDIIYICLTGRRAGHHIFVIWQCCLK